MKLQDYIVPIILSSGIVFGMQYFFGGLTKTVEEPTSFTAPRTQEEVTPLKNAVHYEKKDGNYEPIISSVHTQWGEIGFSTIGGALVSIEHNYISNRKIKQPISTVIAEKDITKQTPCFLLALEENTPLYYNLDQETKLIDKAIIQYSVETDSAKISKKFTIPYNSYQIDLEITITPKNISMPLHFVRVVFQAPRVVDTDGINSIGSVLIDKKGQSQRTKDTSTFLNQGWIAPELFGTETMYFTHLLLKDKNQDIVRTYYTQIGNTINSVLELKPISDTSTIDLSFYMGPKEQDAMMQVDKKMASVFEYQGLLAPIYNFLFMLLKLLYKYLGNFGIAIIALTFLMKLILLPLTVKTEAAQKQHKEFEKKMNYINQKYKNDDERLQLERAELVKNQGFSLIGTIFSGFIIQIPLFMCLNYMLGSTVELYNAPFLWIPDLSGRDPFYILPLFVTGTFMAQSSASADAKKQLNTVLFALVVGAIATRFSAGIALYFAVNTLLAIGQSFLMKKFNVWSK